MLIISFFLLQWNLNWCCVWIYVYFFWNVTRKWTLERHLRSCVSCRGFRLPASNSWPSRLTRASWGDDRAFFPLGRWLLLETGPVSRYYIIFMSLPFPIFRLCTKNYNATTHINNTKLRNSKIPNNITQFETTIKRKNISQFSLHVDRIPTKRAIILINAS